MLVVAKSYCYVSHTDDVRKDTSGRIRSSPDLQQSGTERLLTNYRGSWLIRAVKPLGASFKLSIS